MRLNSNKLSKSSVKKIDGGDYGIQFPWISIVFLIVGFASEITDSLLLEDVLSPTLSELGPVLVKMISYITGAVCFFSMAAIGYQSANEKIEYKTKIIEIGIWLAVGLYLCWLRINGALFDWTNWTTFMSDKNVVMGGLAFLLYIGTGFMTYSSTKQLTNVKLIEYVLAKKQYDDLMNELFEIREDIIAGSSDLSIYPNYCKRLMKSRNTVKKNVGLYNKSVKALIEAKMSVITEPNLMDDMYNDAQSKAQKELSK